MEVWAPRVFLAIALPMVILALVILAAQVGYVVGLWDLPPRALEMAC